ncbi:MAG: cytochrome P450 [Burkholderiales bacterium]
MRTLGTLILSRYDDVVAALKTRHLSVDLIPRTIVQQADKLRVGDVAQVEKFIRNSIVFTDNPEHARLRRLINQAYAPAALEHLKLVICREIGALLDVAAQAETIDAVADLAARLPINVLCAWMGVPEQERRGIGEGIHILRYLLDPGMMTRSQFASVVESMAMLTAFFIEHARTMRTKRDGSLIALLSQARSGDDRLSETEVAFACIMSFVAGNETTQCLIGNTIHALTRFPEQERRLRADPRLMSRAIEESVRYETPLQMTKRLATEDMDINGCPVKAGEPILLCLGAANRDPTAFSDPDTFQIERQKNPHVGFGHGMHACLGGALARMQAEICIAELLTRFKRIESLETQEHWQSHSVILRGLDRLNIRLIPHRAVS